MNEENFCLAETFQVLFLLFTVLHIIYVPFPIKKTDIIWDADIQSGTICNQAMYSILCEE